MRIPRLHIPKFALFGLALIVATALGWMLRLSTADAVAPPLHMQAAATRAPEPDANSMRPIYLTVVTDGSSRGLANAATEAVPTAGGQSTASTMRSESAPKSTDTPATGDAEETPAPAPRVLQTTSSSVSGPMRVQGLSVQGLSVIANGDHIVIANDGAIVSVGDNTVVKGNTGDARASGTIAVDVDQSSLESGDSVVTTSTTTGTSPGTSPAPAAGTTPAGSPATATVPASAAQPTTGSGNATGGRAIGIAGYEVHSIDVSGSDNLVTYDDSNLFVRRTGVVNGNTGDTDTSGLNVVDAERSSVRTGNSGNSDETRDPPPFDPTKRGSTAVPGAPSTLPPGVSSVSVTDINGVSTATGQDSLVIGGDGVDDQGVRVHGNRNVVTYDDGNVAVRGSGKVNAQVGDSDTSGAVVMGVRDSEIRSGDSFLPSNQQAGAQVGDPFDGNDVDVSPKKSP